MAVLTIEDLKNIVESLPGDYTVEFFDSDENVIFSVCDVVQVDISGKRLVLKS